MKLKIIMAVLVAFSQPAAAITVHRVTSLADHGDGTLRAAVAAAASDDRITFAPWLYEKTIRLNSEITINKRLRIEGDMNNDRRPDITLDGQHEHRLLNITSGGNLTLWAVSLEHGKAAEGGAIYNLGTVSAKFCQINENLATEQGGAIYNRGMLSIDSSSVRDNFAATQGGAIYNGKMMATDTAKTTLSASTFAWNQAKINGGVIYNRGGIFGAINSTFANNLVQSRTDWENDTNAKGAVLYAVGGSNKFSDSTLKNNKSAPLREPEQKKCGIRSNSDFNCLPLAELKAKNGQRRINNGGIIYSLASWSSVQLIRTVISESRGRNCGGLGRYTLDHSWSDDNTCDGAADFSEPGTSRGDAKLGPLADEGGYTYTYSPLPDSGLIDAAGTICPVHDQRGARRTRYPDTQCDIGSVDANSRAPSRLRPQTINTTPPAEYNEDIAVLHERIDTLKTQTETQQAEITTKAENIARLERELDTLGEHLEALQRQIAEHAGDTAKITELQTQVTATKTQIEAHRSRIAELEDAQIHECLAVEAWDAGNMKSLTVGDEALLYQHDTFIDVGDVGSPTPLQHRVTRHVETNRAGNLQSSGQIQGDNGPIQWIATSSQIPGSGVYSTNWEFFSAQPFGRVIFTNYVDVDFGNGGDDALIVGGSNHHLRLLVVDGTSPTVGAAFGVRRLRDAQYLGWSGSSDQYPFISNAAVGNEGAPASWPTFTPDRARYGDGVTGYGPADIAPTLAVRLTPRAKYASFEITVLAAPDGVVPAHPFTDVCQ